MTVTVRKISRDQVRGMFLGVAIGDALGVPVETYDAARITREFGRITTYIQNPTHKWSSRKPAGSWSDDTQFTLAIAESLIAHGRLDMDDMVRMHLQMLDELGDLGLGGTTRDAVTRLRQGVHWSESGKTDNPKRGMGNALPMKIAPVGAMLAAGFRPNDGAFNPDRWFGLLEPLRDLTRMTHDTEVALESAFAHVMAVNYCLTRDTVAPDEFLPLLMGAAANARDFDLPVRGQSLTTRLYELRRANVAAMTPQEIAALNGTDPFLVFNSQMVAYAAFLRHPHSVDCLYEAVAAGGDTDTNASIAGGLLGALNGPAVFPDHLVQGLWLRDRIDDTAERLCDRFGITEQ